jgi:DNA-binding NtrC family response regulator
MSATDALNILLVDDETELLGEMARYLQRRGHQVHTAVSYAAGQDLIDNAVAPDVLISDVRMPGGTGLDLARRIQERHPACRIIIMTGHLDEEQIGSAEELGAAAVLFKPFSFRRLLSLVTHTDTGAGGDTSEAMPLLAADPDARS